MSLKRMSVIFTLLLLVVSAALPVAGQEPGDVLVDGLVNPRNLSFDSAGNLYIAETGNGGSLVAASDDAFGATGQVTMVSSDGERSVIVHGFISMFPGASRGLQAVEVVGDSMWVALGNSSDLTIPFTSALVELDRDTGRIKTFVDLLTVEITLDPDGNPNSESNPADLAVAEDGTVYVADASCNCLISWNSEVGVQVVAAWSHSEDNPVPTSVEIGPDGDIYVGFLTGFPFPKGAARVERWSGGELVETYRGLTGVTGLLVTDDGTIYATEFGGEFVMGGGWTPGRVVMVGADGVTPLLENLTSPFGLAQSPAGTIVVAVGADSGGGGQVVVVQ